MTPDGKGLTWQWVAYGMAVVILFLLSYLIIPLLKSDRSAAIYEAKSEAVSMMQAKIDSMLSNQAVVISNQNRVMQKVDSMSDCFPRMEERLKAVENEIKAHEAKSEGQRK